MANEYDTDTPEYGGDNPDYNPQEDNPETPVNREVPQEKVNPQIEQSYKHLQEAYRQSREEIKAFKEKFEGINPQLDAVRKLESVFKEEAKEKNFWQSLPEEYKSQAQKLAEMEQKYAALEQKYQGTEKYLSSQAEANEFKAFDDEMLNGEKAVYDSKEALEEAKKKIVEYIPNALEQWQNGRSLKSLHDEMLGREYGNPNSPLIKSIQARAIRKATGKASNFIDSSGGFSGPSGGGEDSIQIVPSQD